MQMMEATKSNIRAISDRLAGDEITIQQAAKDTGWEIFSDEGTGENPILVPSPNTIHADDGNAEIKYEDMTAEEAAQKYVDSGDWDRDNTTWFRIYTWREGIDEHGEIVRFDENTHEITLTAEEPDCDEGQEHDWQAPYEIVGGIKENPGVWGHGGGVIIHEVCIHCGCERVTDTWAQNRETGEQGLTSVEYSLDKYRDKVEAMKEDEDD